MTPKQIAKARKIILSPGYLARRIDEYGDAFCFAAKDYYGPRSKPLDAMRGRRDMLRFSNRLDRYRMIQGQYGWMDVYFESLWSGR